jgi:hypothetical protein
MKKKIKNINNEINKQFQQNYKYMFHTRLYDLQVDSSNLLRHELV